MKILSIYHRLDVFRASLFTILAFTIMGANSGKAQPDEINWLSFEQLEDSLRAQPKKVFIDFYTSWCTYCRKMDQAAFTNPKVIQQLSKEFYAVKMNAETQDTIVFDGQVFTNTGKRNSPHQLALLLGQRDGSFTPPTLLVLDQQFRVTNRKFEYQTSEQLLKMLQ